MSSFMVEFTCPLCGHYIERFLSAGPYEEKRSHDARLCFFCQQIVYPFRTERSEKEWNAGSN